ncbi:MAG: RDD family protein [Planctomycetota bacterium]|nr:MAG: RDD family protein [Planctomycetota bacterium]
MIHKAKIIVLETPEQAEIRLPIASLGDRILALFLDLLLLFFLSFIIVFSFSILRIAFIPLAYLLMAVMVLLLFLLWNFYFIYYETKRGATWGKLRSGLKVISIDGGFLPASSLFTRNLMRIVEVWMPLFLLLNLNASIQVGFFSSQLFIGLWLLAVNMYPLFDKYNRRLGDLFSGTIVVHLEKKGLESDLALIIKEKEKAKRKYFETPQVSSDLQEEEKKEEFTFTYEMLDFYGKEELETLEYILRKLPNYSRKEKKKLVVSLAEKIAEKIGYSSPIPKGKEEEFLRIFYQEQRRFLEEKLIRGKSLERKEKKNQ